MTPRRRILAAAVAVVALSALGILARAEAQKGGKKSKFQGNWTECKMDPKADPAKFCKCPAAPKKFTDRETKLPMAQCEIPDLKKLQCAMDQERPCSCFIFSKAPKSKDNMEPQWTYGLYTGAGPVKVEKGYDYNCFCVHE